MKSLEDLEFAPMLITEVFDSVKATRAWYDKSKLATQGAKVFPFVSRTRADNGVDSFCPAQAKVPEPGNAITIGLDTQTLGYQPVPFYTGQNIQVLRHKRLDEITAPVLMTLIKGQLRKFSWGGNGATLGRLVKTRIVVPVRRDNQGEQVVDWDTLKALGEDLMAQVRESASNARRFGAAVVGHAPELTFTPMFITDVFSEYRQAPVWLNANQVQPGEPKYPHVTNSAASNSVSAFISRQSRKPNPGNAITIGIDTQVVAYQPAPFYGATKVYELRSPHLNESNALILVAALRRSIAKFSWGHKASAERLRKTRIMVPTTTNANSQTRIDWSGMENYGKWLRSQVDSRTGEALAGSASSSATPSCAAAETRTESHRV